MKRTLLFITFILLLFGASWSYRLVWGVPLNIDHFHERIYIELLLDDPERLSRLGLIDNSLLDFHSDDLTDASPQRRTRQMEMFRRNLEILASYDRESQTPSQRLSTDIATWYLEDRLGQEPFIYHDYPVNQLFGVQNRLPSFMYAIHQVVDEKSARNYIERLSKFGRKFEQIQQGLRLREETGIVPPRFVIEKVLAEMSAFVEAPVEENILYDSFRQKLERLEGQSVAKKEELLREVRSEIQDTIFPAYRELIAYLQVLEPKATQDAGVWKLPDGDAYYAYMLRHHTTTDLSPEEVHTLGLQEVVRIEGEMGSILESLGYGDKSVARAMDELSRQKHFLYRDTNEGRKQILEDYRAIVREIDMGIDEAFARRPAKSVEVKRIPPFKEQTAPGAYYRAPALDGSRPGVFYANLRDVAEIPRFGMRTLSYHEAIPGHHFQIARQQEIEDVPLFRRALSFTAYSEGWALYAERLAWELGFHPTPADNLGRLQAELFRAVRLVVDTGLHYKRWSRQQAIDYMRGKTGMALSDVVTEVERYIVLPAQACAYKIGMLKILELRQRAELELGDAYDIREFHELILGSGPMPLEIMEQQVDEFIEGKKQGKGNTALDPVSNFRRTDLWSRTI